MMFLVKTPYFSSSSDWHGHVAKEKVLPASFDVIRKNIGNHGNHRKIDRNIDVVSQNSPRYSYKYGVQNENYQGSRAVNFGHEETRNGDSTQVGR